MRILYCIGVIVLFGVSAIAQNQTENSIWYFWSGIDFNKAPPKELTDGKGYGASSITDKNGNLIIYTDGNTVWNKNHDVLINGTELKSSNYYSGWGGNNARGTALIVRQPQSNRYFYIFTTDGTKRYYTSPRNPFIPIEPETERENDGVFFSIVDMKADSGRGAVVQKNVPLFKNSSGKLAAAQIQNSDNFWVVGLQELTDTTLLYAYSLTEKGLNIVPVITDVEMEWVSEGQMQFSFGANKLAISEQRKDYNKHFGDGQFCLFDFNTTTGKAWNKKIISAKGSAADFNKTFGLEFSPDGRFIYANFNRNYHYISYTGLPVNNYLLYSSRALYQVDIAKTDSFSTLDSVAILLDSAGHSGGYNYGYSLRLGPDYKLYVNSIGYAIHQPNKKGSLCGLGYTNEDWGYSGSGYGNGSSVPNIPKIKDYFLPKIVTAQEVCIGDSSSIGIYNLMYDSIGWDMGNGEKLITKGVNFKYLYNDTGNYKIIARVFDGGSQDTVSQNIKIYGIVKPKLGRDTLLCTGSTLTLNAYHPTIENYSWTTGETDSAITVKDKSEYIVYASNKLCATADTIRVRNIFPCALQAKNFCLGDTTLIEIKNDNLDSIRWDFGDSTVVLSLSPSITHTYKKGDVYTTTATLYYFGLETTSAISVNIHEVKKPNLGSDILICEGDSLRLKQFDTSYWRYTWSNGIDDHSVTLKTEGIYWLQVESNQCTNGDTLVLKTIDCGIRAKNFCLGDSTIIELKTTDADSVLYSFGDGVTTLSKLNTQHHVYTKGRDYNFDATLYKAGLNKTISLPISIITVPNFDLGNAREVCEGYKLNPFIFDEDISYNWNDSIVTPTILVNQSGVYKLSINKGICTKTDSVSLKVSDCSCPVIYPNAFTPDNNNLNESFMPVADCELKDYELLIFNRWGQLIFTSKNINHGWDGNYKGKPAPNGAYLWMARYKAQFTGKTYNQKGSITLFR